MSLFLNRRTRAIGHKLCFVQHSIDLRKYGFQSEQLNALLPLAEFLDRDLIGMVNGKIASYYQFAP